MRACKQCDVIQPLDNYYRSPRSKDGHVRVCKSCTAEYGRQHRSKPEVKARRRASSALAPKREYNRTRWRDRNYGLRPGQFDALLAAQGGRCAICRSDDSGTYGWAVDHDHACCPGKKSCGKCVRGLLCHRCNPMLGFAQDDIARLMAAADYLMKTSALMSALGSGVPGA